MTASGLDRNWDAQISICTADLGDDPEKLDNVEKRVRITGVLVGEELVDVDGVHPTCQPPAIDQRGFASFD